MKPADDAVIVDSTDFSTNEVVEMMLVYIGMGKQNEINRCFLIVSLLYKKGYAIF
jgi:hypothetical protein